MNLHAKQARTVVALMAGALVVVMLAIPGRMADASTELQAAVTTSDLVEALASASSWLVDTHQNADGGFTSFSTGADLAPSDVGGAVDALRALAAAGGETAGTVAYLRDHPADVTAYAQQDASTAGKLILALVAAEQDPSDFAGTDYVAVLSEQVSADGRYAVDTAFGQALAMLGADAARTDTPQPSAEWLEAQQAKEGEFSGSWDDGFGTQGNADATAMAMMALLAAGRTSDDPALEQAVAFLDGSQLPTGGWEYGAGMGENANSTSLVVEALATLGFDTASTEGQWAVGGHSPLEALLSWQGSNGAFQADFGQGRSDDFFSTVQAMPALAAASTVTQEAPPVAGGDSPLPWILIGVLVVLVAGAALLYYRQPRT